MMAGEERTRGAGRAGQRRTQGDRTYVYVDGTAVRKLQEAPAEQIEKKQNPSTSAQTKRNRERALQMNMGYVTFLTVAAVITMCVCVNFLKLQSVGTKLQKEVTSLETQLSAAVLENDSDYQRIMNSVDMEHVKDVAINELGMVYAKKSQIVTYEMEDNDYVRQYSEVPTE
jgi:cell division protein FtsL